jgi:ribosomal protein L9
MFNEEVIMARLLNGESSANIANEMADLLNKVNKEYIAAEAEKKAEAERIQKKKDEFKAILEQTADWVVKWYPSMEKEMVTETLAEFDVDAMLKEIDSAYKIIDKVKVKKYTSVDEALNDFLASTGW